MPHMPAFHPGLSAASAHNSLKKSLEIMDRAHHCAVLWFGEIVQRKLYRELGYSTMRAYALEELAFSLTRATDFIRLAEKMVELPVLKAELVAGRLGYSKALEIIPVADKSNEAEWVSLAKVKPRTAVRAEVRLARERMNAERRDNPAQAELMPRPVVKAPSANVPIAVGFTLSPGQHARYEAIMASIGHRGGKAELLLAMAEALLAEKAADESEPKTTRRRVVAAPHYQVHLHKCPECSKTAYQAPQGEFELSEIESEAASCDAEIHTSGQRNTTTIPPKIRREVMARDRHQCRRRGCQHTRYLHIHHIVPRADGGTHDPENLVTLCSGCHDLWHRQEGDLQQILTEVVPCDRIE